VGGRPREGDDIGVFKRFVVEVYEKRRYYKEDDGGATDCGVGAGASAGDAPAGKKEALKGHHSGSRSIHDTIGNNGNCNGAGQWGKKHAILPSQRAAAPAPKPAAAAPTVDLLDFGNFDSALPQPTAPSSQTNSQTHPHDIFDPFNSTDPPANNAFDAASISSAPAKQTTSATTATANGTSDDDFFNALQSGTATSTSSVATAPPTVMADPFDPFQMMNANPSTFGSQQQQQTQHHQQQQLHQNGGEKKPIMNTFNGMSNNANNNHGVNSSGHFLHNSNHFNGNGVNSLQPIMPNHMNMKNASSNSVNTGMMMMNGNGMISNSNSSHISNNNHNIMMNGGMMNGNNIYNNNDNNMMMMMNNNNMMMQGGTMGIMLNNTNGNNNGNNSRIMNGNNQGMNAMKPNNNNNINNNTITGNTTNGSDIPAMSTNIMQPTNNNITNNFGMSNAAGGIRGSAKKEDPFAGLGF